MAGTKAARVLAVVRKPGLIVDGQVEVTGGVSSRSIFQKTRNHEATTVIVHDSPSPQIQWVLPIRDFCREPQVITACIVHGDYSESIAGEYGRQESIPLIDPPAAARIALSPGGCLRGWVCGGRPMRSSSVSFDAPLKARRYGSTPTSTPCLARSSWCYEESDSSRVCLTGASSSRSSPLGQRGYLTIGYG